MTYPTDQFAERIDRLARIEQDAWKAVNDIRATVDRSAEKLGDLGFGRTCTALFASMFDGTGTIWSGLDRVTDVIAVRCDDCQRAMSLPAAVRSAVDRLDELYPTMVGQVERIRTLIESPPDDEVIRRMAREALSSFPTFGATALSPWDDMHRLSGTLGQSLSVVSDCRARLLSVQDRLGNVAKLQPLAQSSVAEIVDVLASPVVDAQRRIAAQPQVDALAAYVDRGVPANLRSLVRELRLTLVGEVVAHPSDEGRGTT